MKKMLTAFLWMTSKMIGRQNLEKLLIFSAKSINVNLHLHGLVQIGALNGYYHQIISERFFIEKILPDLFQSGEKLIFFDVGANVGEYSLQLRKIFPTAQIYSFEPVKNTFESLLLNTFDNCINTHNLGFSDKKGIGKIFNTVNNTNAEIASVYEEVFNGIFKNEDEIVAVEFKMDTIDNFCNSKSVLQIDFLKIDVEGHELSVLKGSLNMLRNNRIKVIQFEFNTHNVYSRVFLRDFYQILADFEFYRLFQNGVIKLGLYNPMNEIFTLQNIVAVHKDISHFIGQQAPHQYH